MSKNYDVIHFIQDCMKDKDDKLISLVIRMYNRLYERKCYSSALSTSVTLFISMKYLGYNPELILGTVQYQGISYPHAWLELDQNIYDLAINLDTQYQPVLVNRDIKTVGVQVNTTYEAAGADYYAFQFGDTWIMSDMHRVVGKNLVEYLDSSPYFDILNDVCYILDIPETKDNLNELIKLAERYTIKDSED